MDGRQAGFRRIEQTALLLASLGALAEQAAERSLAVRWAVLTMLRLAEGLAHAYVWDAAQIAVEWDGPAPAGGFSPADAAWLALRFRTLSAILGVLLMRSVRPGGRRARCARQAAAPGRPRAISRAPAVRAYDTS